MYAHIQWSVAEVRREDWILWSWGQATVNHHMWVLRTELWSSPRIVCALNHCPPVVNLQSSHFLILDHVRASYAPPKDMKNNDLTGTLGSLLRCCVSMAQHPDPGRTEAGRTGGAGLLVLCFRNKATYGLTKQVLMREQ